MTRIIYIQDFFPSIITTRSSISVFKKEMNLVEGMSYAFDFTNIHLISRAFADELYKFIKSESLDVKFCHANANITAIYNAVKKSSELPRKDYEQIPITRFKSNDDLYEFLSIV